MIKRREFIAGIGSAAAWTVVARAQQPAMPVIGYLDLSPARANVQVLESFRQALSDAGYVEGRSVKIEYRYAENVLERLPALAADLVNRRVALIVTGGATAAALAAKAATTEIPIVFSTGDDPVQSGLVASLRRPGGNATGVGLSNVELTGKRLGLLRELAPHATSVTYLSVDPKIYQSSYPGYAKSIEDGTNDLLVRSRSIGWQATVTYIADAGELDAAFTAMAARGTNALMVDPFVLLRYNREKLLALAARYKIPAMYTSREYAVAGGLISYGNGLGSISDRSRQMAVYVARILKGEKPADLPVLLPTKFELVINLKTAKALGLTIPETLLATADEVIQ